MLYLSSTIKIKVSNKHRGKRQIHWQPDHKFWYVYHTWACWGQTRSKRIMLTIDCWIMRLRSFPWKLKCRCFLISLEYFIIDTIHRGWNWKWFLKTLDLFYQIQYFDKSNTIDITYISIQRKSEDSHVKRFEIWFEMVFNQKFITLFSMYIITMISSLPPRTFIFVFELRNIFGNKENILINFSMALFFLAKEKLLFWNWNASCAVSAMQIIQMIKLVL